MTLIRCQVNFIRTDSKYMRLCQLLMAETGVRVQTIPCPVCDGQTGTGIGFFSPSLSVISCQHHSTTALYLVMYHLEDGQWAG